MSLWTLLDRGSINLVANTRGQRLALWIGRRLALRHTHLSIPANCRIHPGAKIHPRDGSIQLGEFCSIAEGAAVQGNVTFGHHCSVQMNSILVGYGTRTQPTGRILIGNYVRIAPNVMIFAADHVFDDATKPIHGQGLKHQRITIEDDVWIGGRVNVAAGVTIGRGSVIGAGAVVTHDIPPFSIAVGIPARPIRRRGATAPGFPPASAT